MKYGLRYWCIKLHLWLEHQQEKAQEAIRQARGDR